MKILIVTPEFPPDFGGGIGTYYRNLIPALRSQDCAVSVLKGSAFIHGGKPYDCEDAPVSVLETERFEKWRDRFAHFAMFPELRRHLAAAFAMHDQAEAGAGFDFVEVTDWGLLFLPWVIDTHARVLVQLHGSVGQIALIEPVTGREAEGTVAFLLEKIALEAAACLSTYTRANAQWWKNILGRSIDCLPPPLELKPIDADAKALSDNWISVGRIQHWKGPQVACAAWELLGDQAPPLEWIGRDTKQGKTGESTDASLRNTFPAIWDHRIQPVGQIAPHEVRRRLRAAKVVLVPSTWDVFNLVATEAMGLGKVIVISDGAGAADFVKDGENGFVFPKGNAAALAKLVLRVQKLNKEELNRIGQLALETVREQLEPARIAAEKLKLYHGLPESGTNRISWLRQCLLPDTGASQLAFLDGLPLKELTNYVMRRGFKKMRRRKEH